MTDNNHTDQLDRRLEQVHRVFMDAHDVLRQDLLDQIDQTPDKLLVGTIPISPSSKRKWMMRSTIGLAAAVAIAVIVGTGLFGSGPGSPANAWADVRENLKNATASHSVESVLILDAQGELIQPPIKTAEFWDSEEVKRHKAFTTEGEVSFERVTGDFMLELNHKSKIAELTRFRTYPPPVDSDEDTSKPSLQMLDFVARISDGYARHVGEDVLNNQAVDLYEVQVADMIAFEFDQTGVDPRDDPHKAAVIKMYEGLPPLRIWVSKAEVLPVRIEQPMLPRETKGFDVPEGGKAVGRIDFVAWNQKVDPAMFEPIPPDGWYFENWDRLRLGKELSPNDHRVDMSGLPLAQGVSFRLFGPQGQVLLDDPNLITVVGVTHRTGYDLGNPQIEPWDMLHLSVRLPDDVMQRLQKTLGQASEAHWTFSLGEMTGTIRGYMQKPRDGGEEPLLHLGAFKIQRTDPDAVLNLLETGP